MRSLYHAARAVFEDRLKREIIAQIVIDDLPSRGVPIDDPEALRNFVIEQYSAPLMALVAGPIAYDEQLNPPGRPAMPLAHSALVRAAVEREVADGFALSVARRRAEEELALRKGSAKEDSRRFCPGVFRLAPNWPLERREELETRILHIDDEALVTARDRLRFATPPSTAAVVKHRSFSPRLVGR